MALGPSVKPPHPPFFGIAKRRTSSRYQSKGRHGCVVSISHWRPSSGCQLKSHGWKPSKATKKRKCQLVRFWPPYFRMRTVFHSSITLRKEELSIANINTWINKSRDWHIDGVANKSSVWFFMSTNLQKIPVKIPWRSDVWSTSYSDFSDASLDIVKTKDAKQFRVLIYHCFLMKKNTVQAQQWLEKCYGDSAP